jgi:hypothetical protein
MRAPIDRCRSLASFALWQSLAKCAALIAAEDVLSKAKSLHLSCYCALNVGRLTKQGQQPTF